MKSLNVTELAKDYTVEIHLHGMHRSTTDKAIWIRRIRYMSETTYADLVELEDVCAIYRIKLSVEFIWDRR